MFDFALLSVKNRDEFIRWSSKKRKRKRRLKVVSREFSGVGDLLDGWPLVAPNLSV